MREDHEQQTGYIHRAGLTGWLSAASVEKIGAVLQVVHKILEVKLEDCAKGVKTIDIKAAVQEELRKRIARRPPVRESS